MADGSELLSYYQYGFKDLVFGSDTDFRTEEVEGLLSLPDVDLDEESKQFDHGSHPNIPLMQSRRIDFDMKILGGAGEDIEHKLAIVRKTFQLPRKRYGREFTPFTFWRPGEPKKMIWARCVRRDFTSDFMSARGYASGSVELHASNPLIYSTESYTKTINLAANIQVGTTQVYQEGDYVDGCWPLLTITGPATNIVITNTTDDNRAIRLDLNLGSTSTAIIDVENEIVWVDGVRTSIVIRPDNQWWALLPGENTIQFNRAASSLASSLTITYRNVWQ